MTLALGLVAIGAVLAFVAFMILRDRMLMRRTLKQIRALPTFHGHRKVRK